MRITWYCYAVRSYCTRVCCTLSHLVCLHTTMLPPVRYGSLRGYESAMALHALQPALRKPWMCPGCGLRLVGTFSEVRTHVGGCTAVQGVDSHAVETLGYAQAATGPVAAAASSSSATTPNAIDGRRGAVARGVIGAGGDVDDGPLATAAAAAARAARELEQERERQGRRQDEAVTEGCSSSQLPIPAGCNQLPIPAAAGIDSAVDAEARLHEYLASPVKWGRRRIAAPVGAALLVPPTTAAVLGSFRQMASGPAMTGSGDAGVLPKVLPPPPPLPQDMAPGARATAAAAPPPPLASARMYTCPVCGLEQMLTPPQILQHRRLHG